MFLSVIFTTVILPDNPLLLQYQCVAWLVTCRLYSLNRQVTHFLGQSWLSTGLLITSQFNTSCRRHQFLLLFRLRRSRHVYFFQFWSLLDFVFTLVFSISFLKFIIGKCYTSLYLNWQNAKLQVQDFSISRYAIISY